MAASGNIEVTAGESTAPKWYYENLKVKNHSDSLFKEDRIKLVADDIYKEIRMRGYEYGIFF